jgi:hypothetical protein
VTVVRLGDRLHDRESETGAARCTGASGIGAMEALKHALAFGDRDTGSVVDHREPDLIGADARDLHANEPVFGDGVLDRVASEIAQA